MTPNKILPKPTEIVREDVSLGPEKFSPTPKNIPSSKGKSSVEALNKLELAIKRGVFLNRDDHDGETEQ